VKKIAFLIIASAMLQAQPVKANILARILPGVFGKKQIETPIPGPVYGRTL